MMQKGRKLKDVQTRFDGEGSLRKFTSDRVAVQAMYSQDWPSYNEAKSNEEPLFRQLLVELTLICQEPIQKKVGRTGYLTWERIVFMAVKEYYKSDLRSPKYPQKP